MSAVPKHDTPQIFRLLDNPRVQQGMAAVAGKYLTPEKMLRLCINAVKKTPRLLECDPQTVLGAMMTSAALGLEPNTVTQQAFLIPYKRRAKVGGEWIDVYDCQFQVGARGFLTLAYRVPEIKLMKAEAIHRGDHWKHMDGSSWFLEYAKALRDRGELDGAFSYVRMDDGIESACVLPYDELMKIRERSETYRALVRNVAKAESDKDRQRAQQQLDETPWVMWIDDMAAKSAIKKHAKQLPLTGSDGTTALMAAANIDSQADTAVIDMRMMADPDIVRSTVADGDEPPRALENDPSPTLDEAVPGNRSVRMPRARARAAAAQPASAPAAAAAPASASGPAAAGPGMATEGERAFVRRRLAELSISEAEACADAGITSIDTMTTDGFIAMKELIAGAGGDR